MVSYPAFVLFLFAPHLSFFWCFVIVAFSGYIHLHCFIFYIVCKLPNKNVKECPWKQKKNTLLIENGKACFLQKQEGENFFFFFFKLLASEFVFTQHAKRQVIVQVVENQFKEACITLSHENICCCLANRICLFSTDSL